LGVGIPLAVLFFWELYYSATKKMAVHSFVQQEPQQSGQVLEKQEDAHQQNVFGIKIIAASIAVVGAGVALLGSFAEKGRVALIVGTVVFLLSFPLWRSASKQ
jgi:SSS family solute:Na+ symporter